jgi:hypothetical protein
MCITEIRPAQSAAAFGAASTASAFAASSTASGSRASSTTSQLSKSGSRLSYEKKHINFLIKLVKYSVIFLIFFSQRVTVIDASFQHNMIRPFVHWAYSMRERRAREMGGRSSRGGEDESYGKQQSKREGAREHRGGTKERGYRKRKRGTKRKERGFQQRTDSIIYIPAAYRCIVRGKHVREDAGRRRNHARPPITRFSLLSFLHKDVHSFSSTLG